MLGLLGCNRKLTAWLWRSEWVDGLSGLLWLQPPCHTVATPATYSLLTR
jgi:hypothetical protein